RDAADSEMQQRLDRSRRRAEVEDLRRPRAAFRDAALEVQHEQVGRARDLGEFRVDEGLRRPPPELLRDGPPEHRVPCEGQPHGKPYLPWSRTKCAPPSERTRRSLPPRFSKRTTSSSPPGPSGCTSRPPSASCSASGAGTVGQAAATRI